MGNWVTRSLNKSGHFLVAFLTVFLVAMMASVSCLALSASTKPGCSSMVETFCKDLYNEKNLGNLSLKINDQQTVSLHLGEMKSGIRWTTYHFFESLLAAYDVFPHDLKAQFDRRKIKVKIEQLLKKIKTTTWSEKSYSEQSWLSNELMDLLSQSREQVLIDRMTKLYPLYNVTKVKPVEWELEEKKQYYLLASQYFVSAWKQNPKWLETLEKFKKIQQRYLVLIDQLKISDELKKSWKQSIQTVELRLPGQDPKNIDSMTASCATTTVNAWYVNHRHVIEICPQIFSVQLPDLVLAHEIAHAIGPGRKILEIERSYDLWKKLSALRQKVCLPGFIPSCQSEWKEIKANFSHSLSEIQPQRLEPYDFLKCLQYKKDKIKDAGPTRDELLKASEQWSTQDLGSLADRDLMLSLISQKIPREDGRMDKNIRYLRPCDEDEPTSEKFSLWDTAQLVYLMEYLCLDLKSEHHLDGHLGDLKELTSSQRSERMKQSAEFTIQWIKQIYEPLLMVPGRFSRTTFMTARQFAEAVDERFADYLASRVMALALKDYPSREGRQNTFKAMVALYCDRPSLSWLYPKEAQVQKEFSFEPHSLGAERRIEILIPELRESLECEQDFVSRSECKL